MPQQMDNQMKIDQIIEILEKEEKRINFSIPTKSQNCYAIGKNTETLSVNRLIPLMGIIDDCSSPGALWNGIPLIKLEHTDKNAIVINCSTSIRPIDTSKYLVNAGFTSVINFFELAHALNDEKLLPNFVKDHRIEVLNNLNHWQAIFDALTDPISKKTFLDTLKFRWTANPGYMKSYKVRLSEQYFEDFMDYSQELFVDAGGFDGDTAETFATRHPDYRKIIVFEPSKKNIALARKRLHQHRDIDIFGIGLSDKKQLLRFNAEIGSACTVTEDGSEEILVDTLDSLIKDPVTFIKMDLEGWEIPAIKGASGHIRSTTPKLAIATYHRAADLRNIYQLIESFDKGYEIYLRHYTQGWSETVMFFKPPSKLAY